MGIYLCSLRLEAANWGHLSCPVAAGCKDRASVAAFLQTLYIALEVIVSLIDEPRSSPRHKFVPLYPCRVSTHNCNFALMTHIPAPLLSIDSVLRSIILGGTSVLMQRCPLRSS